jgi:TPR repeat protein
MIPSTASAKTLFETAKRLYLARPGCGDDALMAASYFARAAELGYAPAQRVLGIMCLEGDQVEKDPGKAVRWLTAAAEQNDPQACFRLAVMLARGEALAKDWSKAYGLLVRPGLEVIPEAKELRRRLRGELVSLYPALAKALAQREAKLRSALDRFQSRQLPLFVDPAQDCGDYEEFKAWLGLNLGQLTAEAAYHLILGRLELYYSVRCPAAQAPPPETTCP